MNKINSDFMWGGAVTSWQTEGAYNQYGKGLSIIDIRKTEPDHTNFNDGIDEYHRYKEDIALFKELGFNSYRFSVSWSRIMPDGESEINQEGLNFYNNFINELIANGIEPIITIYHFDLPLALKEKYNGFLSRKVIDLYEQYARILYEHFGDRVKHWISFNEINTARKRTVHYGAEKPKNISEEQFSASIIHNVMIAHALATKALHEMVPDAKMSGMVTYIQMYPETCNPNDVLEYLKAKELMNDMYLDVFTHGEYPSYFLSLLEKKNISLPIEDGDLEILKNNTVDYLSISYYRSETVSSTHGGKENDLGFNHLVNNPYLVETEWGWAMDPIGLNIALKEIYARYNLPIFIVESGIGVRETLNSNLSVNDDYRINYLKNHIEQIKLAIQDGVNVLGYLVWAPIDIISSLGEMKKRYGFIYVNRDETDLKDLKRYKKKSFNWYKKVIQSNGEDLSSN